MQYIQKSEKGEIGQRLFALLEIRGISVAQLSKGTKINETTIGDWKRKRTNPSSDKIYSICEFLGVSAEWLLTGKEREQGASAPGEAVRLNLFNGKTSRRAFPVINGKERSLSAEAAELLRLYEAADLRKKLKILDFALKLSDENLKHEGDK